jgi:hypothetical protein
MLPGLAAAVAARAPSFEPAAERDALLRIVDRLLGQRPTGTPP